MIKKIKASLQGLFHLLILAFFFILEKDKGHFDLLVYIKY
jgi:hypothetical protein